MNADRDGSESRAKTCAECGWWHTGECCDHHPELSDDQGTCHHPAHAAPESAPAGIPLHEATDRDAGTIPSDEDRVREYAEAIHGGWCLIPSACDGPGDRDLEAARACVEVEKRHTAALRQRLLSRGWRAKKAEATIARVEALADHFEESFGPFEGSPYIHAASRIRAALRGPEPTEETP